MFGGFRRRKFLWRLLIFNVLLQSLVDGENALLTRAQQRGLLRVANRPWLRGTLLAPFGLIGADERTRGGAGDGGE